MNGTANMEELREKIARAIYEDRNGRGATPWGHRSLSFKAPYLVDASAALRAIEEAGYRVVKDEPLPCDVKLPPATTISQGCTLGTLLAGLEVRRKGFPEVSAEQVAAVQDLLKAEFSDDDWEMVESEADALKLEEPRG